MLRFLSRNVPSHAAVLFRGALPMRPESLARLESRGIAITRLPDAAEAHWALGLEHPQWGSAEVVAPRERLPDLDEVVAVSQSLTDGEKRQVLATGHALRVRCDATRSLVLRDRKNLLRFVREVMGDDSPCALDTSSQLFWPRASLDDELAHDSDLDVCSVHCLHAVTDDDRSVSWLHSHGLPEMGAFDFDILRPDASLTGPAQDGLRALALAILEGSCGPSEAAFRLAHPGGDIAMVPVAEFDRRASPSARALREDPGGEHARSRSVACDPRGLLGRLLGGVRPSGFLSSPIDDGTVFAFSTGATELMASRARATLDVFASLGEEFGALELPRLVKLGYPVDGGDGSESEHLWFEVHGMDGTAVDATLINEPHAVSRLQSGQRGRFSTERLTDWVIMTPLGSINPRQLGVARAVRERRTEIERALRTRRDA